jgi:hypothetical protein
LLNGDEIASFAVDDFGDAYRAGVLQPRYLGQSIIIDPLVRTTCIEADRRAEVRAAEKWLEAFQPCPAK